MLQQLKVGFRKDYFFHVITHDPETGAAKDADALPVAACFLADSPSPIAGNNDVTVTKHPGFGQGVYIVKVPADALGIAAGGIYNVTVRATVTPASANPAVESVYSTGFAGVANDVDDVMNAIAGINVQSDVDAALVARRLHYINDQPATIASNTHCHQNSILGQMIGVNGNLVNYDRTRDSLEAIGQAVESGGAGLSQQDVADAMNLAPSPGTPAGGSVHDKLDTISGLITDPSGTQTPIASGNPPDYSSNAELTFAGQPTDTQAPDGSLWQATTSGGAAWWQDYQIDIGTDRAPIKVHVRAQFIGGGQRQAWCSYLNPVTGSYIYLSTGSSDDTFLRANPMQDYVFSIPSSARDDNNKVTVRLGPGPSNAPGGSDRMDVDYLAVEHVASGSITVGDIAEAVKAQTVNRDYPDSAIYLDTINGQDGAEIGLNGTPFYPVQTFGAAMELLRQTRYRRLVVVQGSNVTLGEAFTDYSMYCNGATINLNNQDINDSVFHDGTVTGSFTTGGLDIPVFERCVVDTLSGPLMGLRESYIGATGLSFSSECVLDRCRSAFSSKAFAIVNFNAAGNAKLKVAGFDGFLQLKNMSSTAVASLQGVAGEVELDTDVAAGAVVALSGIHGLTDNSLGAIIEDGPRLHRLDQSDSVWNDEPTRTVTNPELANLDAAVSTRASATQVSNLNDIAAADVWAHTPRSLTDWTGAPTGTTAQEVWEYATRSLTDWTGAPGGATAQEVWEYATRSLTDWTGAPTGTTAQEVWEYGTRSLTDKAGFSISGVKQTLDALNDIDGTTVTNASMAAMSNYRLDELMVLSNDTLPSGTSLFGRMIQAPAYDASARQFKIPTVELCIATTNGQARSSNSINTIQLADSEPGAGNDNIYTGSTIAIHAGTGAKQARSITEYNSTTKVCTVSPNWVIEPDNTSHYVIYPTAGGEGGGSGGNVNVTSMAGVPLSGKAGENFNIHYNNNGTTTTKVVDDTGVAGSGLSPQQVRDAMQLSPTNPGSHTGDSIDGRVSTASRAADVWDAARDDYNQTDTMGEAQGASATVDPQTIRDAMKLAPSGGAPASGSIDERVSTDSRAADIWDRLVSLHNTTDTMGEAQQAPYPVPPTPVPPGDVAEAVWSLSQDNLQIQDPNSMAELQRQSPSDLRWIEGLRTDNNLATLKLKQLDIRNNTEAGPAVFLQAQGDLLDDALRCEGTNNGIRATGSSAGIFAGGGGSGDGIIAKSGGSGGIGLNCDGVDKDIDAAEIDALPTAEQNAREIWDEDMSSPSPQGGSTKEALSNAGGIGAVNVTIAPLDVTVADKMPVETDFSIYRNAKEPAVVFSFLNADGSPKDLSGYGDIRLNAYKPGTNQTVWFRNLDDGITVAGTSFNQLEIRWNPDDIDDTKIWHYTLLIGDTEFVLASGAITVLEASMDTTPVPP